MSKLHSSTARSARTGRHAIFAASVLGLAFGIPEPAGAQEPVPPPGDPAAPLPEPAPAVPPVPAAPLDSAPPAAPEPPPPAPVVEEPAPLTTEVVAEAPVAAAPAPALKLGVGVRTGLRLTFSDPAAGDSASLRLDDGLVDQFNIRPYLSGQLTDQIGFAANFEVGTRTVLGIGVLDLVLQVKLADEFQVWIGQHVTAQDRNNMSGPFYQSSWNFPITVHGYPFDTGARDRGFTLWGLVAGGVLKYHVSVVDLQPPASAGGRAGASLENAHLAGRVTLNLLDPENYYYASGTYYGEQDTLALGLAGHYQKGVDSTDPAVTLDNDFGGISADLLFEKNLDASGTITLEGGYWNFKETGADYLVNQGTVDQGLGVWGPPPGTSYTGAVSWLTPSKVGLGKIQISGRFQVGNYPVGAVADNTTVTIDAGLGYIIDSFNHRWHLNFRTQDNGDAGPTVNMIQTGAQFQM
jgi:hypothetical protein